MIENDLMIWFSFLFLDFSYGDNGTFSPPMDVTNQTQNSNIQLTSGNSNYSSGSGGDSPTSLSPGRKMKLDEKSIIIFGLSQFPCHPEDNLVVSVEIQTHQIVLHQQLQLVVD